MDYLGNVTEFANTLAEIIARSFEGNGMELCRQSGIPRPVLSKLLKPSLAPSTKRLEELAAVLSLTDRRQLLLAAARDIVPEEFKDQVFPNRQDPTAQLLRGQLPDDVRRVLEWLERDSLKDVSTRHFLRRIGKMIGLQTNTHSFSDHAKEVSDKNHT